MTTPIQSLNVSLPPLSSAAATTDAGSNYTDLNGLAALKNAPNSPAAIHAVAQQVEALFLQMMLKSMRDASAADGEPDSNETGMYQDMFDKQVALTLSKHQDLGIARLFERQLGGKASDTHAATAAAPATPSGPPTIGLSAPGTHADGRRAGANASDSVTTQHAAQFVSAVLPTIRRVAQGLGVNPLGLLAQAALETGWGRRMAHTADGSPSLNLFGIKAGESWNGSRAVADTVEFNGGVATQRRTAFRAYGSIEESVNDFANLLSNSPRYRDAVAAGNDAQAYIHSIARSGYASDPEYGNKLNKILNSDTLRSALGVRVAAL
jgi:peptidoglycan hydrolase FlgJ